MKSEPQPSHSWLQRINANPDQARHAETEKARAQTTCISG
jgi:hypothetical protein